MLAENTAPTMKKIERPIRMSGVAGQREQQREDEDDEDREGAELPIQVRRGALLDGAGRWPACARCPRSRRAPRDERRWPSPSATRAMTATTTT